MIVRRAAGSFRDPAGHVVLRGRQVHRLVMPAGRRSYEQLMQSGLYEQLTRRGLLVEHEEIPSPAWADPGAWRVLTPVPAPLVTYPYEWSFSALRDAALLTLAVQREAVRHGMTLKDASAYNVEFFGCRPVFIDTLSFEPLESSLWRAYRQFCQHFVAPIALMAYCDVRLGRLLRLYPDGVPLDLASRLLPARTWARLGILFHVHLHARAEARGSRPLPSAPAVSAAGPGRLNALLDSLERTISKISWTPSGGWTQYDREPPSYSARALARKIEIVDRWIRLMSPGQVWDLGANTGRFGRLAASRGAFTVALDEDAGCVDLAYRQGRKEGTDRLLPMVVDLAAPSPALGWAHEERRALADRGPADLLLALALVHHLAIGRGLPFDELARYFARLGRALIVEFVPAGDPQVEPLLARFQERAEPYTQERFEAEFSRHFQIRQSEAIADSTRRLFLMIRR
jgi:hypothetical protein